MVNDDSNRLVSVDSKFAREGARTTDSGSTSTRCHLRAGCSTWMPMQSTSTTSCAVSTRSRPGPRADIFAAHVHFDARAGNALGRTIAG